MRNSSNLVSPLLTGGILLVALMLAACSSQPMYEERDVLKAKNTGGLYVMYDRMTQELTLEKPSSDRANNIRTYQEKVGEEIANEKEQKLLNNLGRNLAEHTISQLKLAKTQAADIQAYNDAVYLALVAQLDSEIHEKEKQLALKQAEFDRLGLLDSKRKMALLDEMITLSGGEKGKQLTALKAQYVDGLLADAKKLMEQKKYEKVVVVLEQVELLDANYPGLQAMEYALIEAEYEQQFWDALSSADKDKSFELLKRLTAIPNYLQNNADIIDIAKSLRNLFLDDAKKAMSTMSIVSAYPDFSKANFIQKQLGTVKIFDDAERQFIRIIENKFIDAEAKNNTVLAYGLLSIIEELDYDNRLVEEFSPSVNNTMLQQATVKVVPKPLTSKPADAEVAKVFANALAQRINSVMKSSVDVYNVDAQQSLMPLKDRSNPSAWFEVSGELLEALRSSTTEAEREVRSVLVSYQTVENPAYVAWSSLSKRQRQDKAEPPITIEKAIHKDVTITRINMKKHMKLTASYRLLDQSSKSVLFFGSQTNETQAQGYVQKAIKEGLFTLPEEKAVLPLDADMLGQVIADAVTEITEKLKPEIEKLDARYIQAGEIAYAKQSYVKAAKQFAYADVLAKSKARKTRFKQSLDVGERLRNSVMRWK